MTNARDHVSAPKENEVRPDHLAGAACPPSPRRTTNDSAQIREWASRRIGSPRAPMLRWSRVQSLRRSYRIRRLGMPIGSGGSLGHWWHDRYVRPRVVQKSISAQPNDKDNPPTREYALTPSALRRPHPSWQRRTWLEERRPRQWNGRRHRHAVNFAAAPPAKPGSGGQPLGTSWADGLGKHLAPSLERVGLARCSQHYTRAPPSSFEVIAGSAPKGRRHEATGEAQRNPWNRRGNRPP
jgi:hypothetical protein